jgi:hypothetical protein
MGLNRLHRIAGDCSRAGFDLPQLHQSDKSFALDLLGPKHGLGHRRRCCMDGTGAPDDIADPAIEAAESARLAPVWMRFDPGEATA